MFRFNLIVALAFPLSGYATPVEVTSVTAESGIVVAAHPEAAEIGVEVLRSGGNAVDAAIATSLALGVAEPFASGLGGKLMLLYYHAASGRTYALEAMDAASTLNVSDYLQRPDSDWSYGYGAVCVPGLPAGLWAAHQRWGSKPWADNVRPALELARRGAEVLPKSRDLFAEQESWLRGGDAEIARIFLPGGDLPKTGSRLPNPDLARTLEAYRTGGRDGFYRGRVAAAIIAASNASGGLLSADDLAGYEPRITEPVCTDFRGFRLVSAPPPTCGATILLPLLKSIENETFSGGPLRTVENLEKLGRIWRVVAAEMGDVAGDVPESRELFEALLTPKSIADMRHQAFGPIDGLRNATVRSGTAGFYESPQAATTHFVIVDRAGNIVTATQSLSVHFGAGVVPPGTGVVLNNSMSNFSYDDPTNINYVAPHKRARSTIAPTLVFRDGRPLLALGVPGSSRIPSALIQVLIDRLTLDRPLADAIGDTRFHFRAPTQASPGFVFEAESSLPASLAAGLVAKGWKVSLPEDAGRGRYFGGVNAVEFNPDGSMTGYADLRRTNAVLGQ